MDQQYSDVPVSSAPRLGVIGNSYGGCWRGVMGKAHECQHKSAHSMSLRHIFDGSYDGFRSHLLGANAWEQAQWAGWVLSVHGTEK